MARTTCCSSKLLTVSLCSALLLAVSLLATNGRAQAGGDITYIYDELGRLVGVVDQGGETVVYTYDAVGNLLAISRRSSSVASIIEFTPNSGPAGTSVTVYGTGFSATAGENTVDFNGVAAAVISSSPTHLTANVPAGSTTGYITVTTPAGTATSAEPFAITAGGAIPGAPTITGFSPTIGLPGTTVTISGSNFETTPANNKLRFDTVPAVISSAEGTSVIAGVPASGSGRISIETPFGRAVSENDFFVPPAPYIPEDVSVAERIAFSPGVLSPGKIISLPQQGRIGMYLFDGVAGGRISMLMTDFEAAFRWTVYKPDGKELFSAENQSWQIKKFVDTQVLPATGTYTIVAKLLTTGPSSISLKLFNVPPDVTSTIGAGHFVNVQITTPGQNGALTFNGEAGQKIFVLMEDMTIPTGKLAVESAARVTLVEQQIPPPPANTTVVSRSMSLEFPPEAGTTLPTDGPYTIHVNPDLENTGDVKVSLYLMPPDPTLSISVGGPTVQVQSVLYEAVEKPPPGVLITPPPPNSSGTNWWLVFDGMAGQKVSLKMTGITIPGATYVSVNKPDGTYLVGRTPASPAEGFIDTFTLPASGTYKIFVDPSGKSTGEMSLTLYDAADLTGAITPGGPPVTVTTNTPGQNALLNFNGTAGQKVSLQAGGVTVPGTTSMSLRKEDGTVLTSTNISTGGGATSWVTLPAAGAYAAYVNPEKANTGGVTLTLNSTTDVTGTITPGGQPVTVTTTPGQNARITFDGVAGQNVSLKLSGVTIQSSNVSILKPDGTALAPATWVGTGGGFIDTRTLPLAGTYTILVDPLENYAGNMTLTLYDVVDVPGQIAIGGAPTVGTVTVPGQRARLSFEGTAGQRVSLKMTSIGPDSTVSIVKPDGGNLASQFVNFGTGQFIDTKVLPATGTYTLVMDPSVGLTGSITFTLYNVPPDIINTIVPGGPPVTVTIGTPGQNANLTFSGTAGRRVSVNTTAPTSLYPSDAPAGNYLISKPDGTALAGASSLGRFAGPYDLPATGTYTISLNPGAAHTGNVTTTLYDVTDVTGTIEAGGPAVPVTIGTPGQNVRLSFDGTAGQRVSLNVTNVSVYPSYVSINKPDGSVLKSPTIVGTGGSFVDPVTLPVDGTYTILLDPSDNSTGGATLTLYTVVDATGTILPGGDPVAVTISVPGQNGRFTFGGTAGQRVSLKVTGVSIPSGYVHINKPDGTSLKYTIVRTNGAFIDVTSLPVSGTYTVLLDPDQAYTGSATLALYDVVDTTGAITPGGAAVTATVSVPGQSNRITFDGTANQRISLRVGSPSYTGGDGSPSVASVSISKPDGTSLVAPTTFGGSGTFIDTRTLPVSGSYTILIDTVSSYVGSSVLTLYDVPADAAASTTIGAAAVSVAVAVPGQNAKVTFAGAVGQQVTVRVTNNAMGNVEVKLLKPDGTSMTSTTTGGAAFNLSTQTLPAAGTYTVSINPYQHGGTGGMSVGVTSP